MEPKLANTKGIKTYLNSRNKFSKSSNSDSSKEAKGEPLTTKDAVRFLLQGTLKWRACRFCLTSTTSLSELDEIFEVASGGALYQVTIRDMIATFYPYQVGNDANLPNKICGKCLDRTINCYIFVQQCERADRALRNCFSDINEKFDKLDPLERVKRRGRQKLHPNHNVLHSDYKKVISYADPLINIVNVAASLEENSEDTEINELECPKCWQVLPNVESFINHEKVHPKSMWFNCRLCGLSFIKHSQYKKHIKQCHIRKMLPAPSIKKKEFQCSECGTFNDDFGKHLQHIEKHKFKNILEHLIERKMDDLCGVCLDKGEKMVELSETYHLHAGYPELTGEKTLSRVLSESIPEQLYKYEEFYVANKPDIAKMKRRSISTLIHTIDFINFDPKNQMPNFEKTKKMSCKICWIFNDAQCDTCIRRTTIEIDTKQCNNRMKTKNCNMCWIFTKVGKCNFCKAALKNVDNSIAGLKGLTEKRKIYFDDETEIIKPKLKWHQSKVLINNNNPELCMMHTYEMINQWNGM